MAYLEKVDSIQDLKKLKESELSLYAEEVRQYICDTVERQGGHLASNLGTVELITALHYTFDCPKDKLIFDVGHQTYTHKIITGRKNAFSALRSSDGVSGFPKISESEYDAFSTGHSSTSLSVALGMARARDIKGDDYNVVAVIGDGALTGGMALEALNDIGANKERVIIIINDNKMSISKNVGALSKYFAKLRLSRRYAQTKRNLKNSLSTLPVIGDGAIKILDKIKFGVKNILIFNKFFEDLGFNYYGPFDGHDIPTLNDLFQKAANDKGPVILHVLTEKGRGHECAQNDPSNYHSVPKKNSGAKENSYTKVLSEKLIEVAGKDERVVAVTAAMQSGTGLKEFSEKYPDRYFDVGIAEEHAVTMCAGMAAMGLKPYFAVYSSFLQRAFDQIMHDVCLESLPVTLLVDHAGAVEGDGVTHQGIYDISYLSMIPNLTVLQPKDGAEFARMLDFSVDFGAPLAIRYPKCYLSEFSGGEPFDESLRWEYLRRDGEVCILAAGDRMLSLAMQIQSAAVVNARVIKPFDIELLSEIKNKYPLIITLEDNVLAGGFGDGIRRHFSYCGEDVKTVSFGFSDRFVQEYSLNDLYENAGLTKQNIQNAVNSFLNR